MKLGSVRVEKHSRAMSTADTMDSNKNSIAIEMEKESSVWSSDAEQEKDDKSAVDDKKIRRRAQIAKSARKHRIRQKAELQNLRTQVQELSEALKKARQGGHGIDPPALIEIPLEVGEFEMQTTLRGLWLNAPLHTDTGPGPNVYHPFHHVPISPNERHSKLLEIAKPGPMRMYQQIVEDTNSIPSFPPYVDVRMTSMGENVSVKFSRVCEITSFDHKTVSDVFWTNFWGFGSDGTVSNAGLCKRRLLTQLDSTCHYEHVSYVVPNMPDVRLESLDVVTRTSYPHYTIFTWESVDLDEMNPAPLDHHTIRREEIGGIMFRTEADGDGTIRTVLRTVIYSRPFVRKLPKIFSDMNEPFAHLYCRMNVIAEEQVSRYLLQKFMTS